jgi:putative transposase
MARLPRLVLPGHAHCVLQQGQGTRPVFCDAEDRTHYLAALRAAAPATGVQLLAWALLPSRVLLLARPTQAAGLGQLLQAVGRRYVSTYNRRHGAAGTLWDGRYRCALVEPGPVLLDVLAWVDGQSAEPGHTSAALRLAGQPDALLHHPPEFWALGNTPFDREAAWRRRLAEGTPAAQVARWEQATRGGWALGSPGFVAALAAQTTRPLQPRTPGRPRKAPGGGTPHA